MSSGAGLNGFQFMLNGVASVSDYVLFRKALQCNRDLDIFSLKWRTPSLILFPLSVIPSALYRYSSASRRSALLTDVLSMSFCHNALSLLKLDSFKTGTALLSGLFIYDIWWVFGTPVVSRYIFATFSNRFDLSITDGGSCDQA